MRIAICKAIDGEEIKILPTNWSITKELGRKILKIIKSLINVFVNFSWENNTHCIRVIWDQSYISHRSSHCLRDRIPEIIYWTFSICNFAEKKFDKNDIINDEFLL